MDTTIVYWGYVCFEVCHECQANIFQGQGMQQLKTWQRGAQVLCLEEL